MKKLLCIIFFLIAFTLSYGAPTTITPANTDEGKFMLTFGSDFLYNPSNDILSIFDLGARFGLPGGFDVGLNIYKLGAILDLKYFFLRATIFTTAIDLEGGFNNLQQVWGGLGIVMGMELEPFLGVYTSFRWRYPAIKEIDSIQNDVSGVVFIMKFGLELFRQETFSFLLEGGFEKSWSLSANPSFDLTAAAMVHWKLY
jgi:hypothetical protein